MKRAATTFVLSVAFGVAGLGHAQDWPQWRGPNRDAKATGFTAPAAWPKELHKKWSVPVGDGVASPSLVGDKLYVFARQEGKEIIRCLSAADGKTLWQESYEVQGADGPARGFAGPRATPVVTNNRVITLGVRGAVSCFDAASGKQIWRKDDVKGFPRFYTSSSPIVVDGLCIAQLGDSSAGSIVAYDVANGDEKWKWSEDGTAYASPVLVNLGNTKAIVAETEQNIVVLGITDGKLRWKTDFSVQRGGGRAYNACTPIVDGQTIYYSGVGRGTKAVRLELNGDTLSAKELWSNPQIAVQFNTPVIKNGMLYGISDRDQLFCLNAESGKTEWTTEFPARARQRGYGSIVDAGKVLLALNPGGQLIVFEPNDKSFKQLASYKVAEADTFGYPVASGNRLFIKDRDKVTLWEVAEGPGEGGGR
jgi:outer membrane protein assembly factor BamB